MFNIGFGKSSLNVKQSVAVAKLNLQILIPHFNL